MSAKVAISTLAAALMAAGCGGSPRVSPDPVAAMQIREILEQGGGGGSRKAAKQADPTGFASITGAIRFTGSAPTPAPLALEGDDAPLCRAGGTEHVDESIVVGPDGALKNTLVFISSKIPVDTPGWIHESYAGERTLAPFDQKGCIFLSHVFAMQSNQSLVIKNSDSMGHNTNIQGGGDALPTNPVIPPGQETIYTPGGASGLPMPVSCNIHRWMTAHLMVVDHPYFFVTGDDGKFTLANLPAGVELELRAWQETNKMVFSDSSGQWSRGRRTITLEPGKDVTLDISVAMK